MKGTLLTCRIGQAVIVIVGSLVLASCSGNSDANPAITPVMAVVANTGSPQSHAVKGVFGIPLVALVTSNGLPASGVAVTFTAPASGPSGTFTGKSALTATATSDANGLATSPTFTANATVGIYTVTASVPGTLTPANFDLTNTTGAPALVTATAGNGQSAAVEQPFTNPLQVKVVDSGNNPVSNAMVIFTAPATGASSIFSDTATTTTTAVTNASGVATSAPLSANGVAGADNVVASVSGAISATFGLTNLAGPANTISIVSGNPQSAIANQTYGAPLTVLVVDSQQNPVANTAVTFVGPTSTTAAGVTFTSAVPPSNTITVMTNSNGVASSGPFRANAVAGTFTVFAQANEQAEFTLTNWPLGSQYYSFYLSGQDVFSFSFYGLAGSVLISPTGTVLTGEQDYNDGELTSPQPSGDTITGGSLTLNSTTEQGTLVLDTNNLNVGNTGVETFAVQFVNSNHALIAEYDATSVQGSVISGATSSGSLDLQTLPAASTSNLSGGYAFTLAGDDPLFFPVAYGGVFSITGSGQTLQNGLLDTNDTGLQATTPVVTTTGVPLTGTLSLPDSFGRGTITIPALNYSTLEQTPVPPVSLNYYIVGPEVIRIIDVDSGDAAIGSAFGQGVNATTASDASLGTSIFGVEGTVLANQYGAAGMFSTNSAGTISNGVADDSELAFSLTVPDAPISGAYSIAANGYGSMTVPAGDLGDVSAFGLYMTDPSLNLLDPNNTTSGSKGGALLLDLDTVLGGGAGVVIPQTSTSSTFTGQFAFGGQDQNCIFYCGEFDFVGEADVTTGPIQTLDAFLSDPFTTLGELNPTNTAKFEGTPQADPSNLGRFTMLSSNATPNPLNIKVPGVAPQPFNVVMYQANANEFFWLDEDVFSVFLGSLQQWGTFTTVPGSASAKPAMKMK
jgi:hypothetical protein